MSEQIKSKERVAEHGEVFTNEREVNAMLDMVESETDRIDSRFLEPACGTGNFLAEVLRRKLNSVKRQYGKLSSDYEKYSVLAVSSIYGVDIQQDNVEECRNRMFDIWDKEYRKNCKAACSDECQEAVRYILAHNILCGDALTMLQNNGAPITFAQWDLVMGSMLKRRDYQLDQLMEGHEQQMSLDMCVDGRQWEYDSEIDAMVPAPVKEYPNTDYREVQKYG